MLKVYDSIVGLCKKHPQHRLGVGDRRSYDGSVFRPFVALYLDLLACYGLSLTHAFGRHKLNPYLGRSLSDISCPHREAILLAFFYADTEEAFVLDAGVLVAVAGCSKAYIMRIALKRTVIFQFHSAKCGPAHEILRKVKRAVLYQFGIKAAVSRIIYVFKEKPVHGRLYRRSGFVGLEYQFIGSRIQRQSGTYGQRGQ